jgi:hypothetical protein
MTSQIELGCSTNFDVSSMSVTSADLAQMMIMIILFFVCLARSLNYLGELLNNLRKVIHLL